MNSIQQQIIDLSKKEDISKLSYRKIGDKIGLINPNAQKIKHHMQMLEKKMMLLDGDYLKINIISKDNSWTFQGKYSKDLESKIINLIQEHEKTNQ